MFRCLSGPDSIPAKVLRTYSQGLSPVSHLPFSKIYLSATIASVWKTATIIPVPKKHGLTELNYYRPVALRSIIMKRLEKLLLNIILPVVPPQPDPLQFANNAPFPAPGFTGQLHGLHLCFFLTELSDDLEVSG